MRFTVVANTMTGLHDDPTDEDLAGVADILRDDVERAKWHVWHGNIHRALPLLGDTSCGLLGCDTNESRVKTANMLDELIVYLDRNQATIPNYTERRLAGEPISSAAAEATVNLVIAARMVKKQQMRWSPHGAHRMLTSTITASIWRSFSKSAPASSTTNSTTASTAGTHAPRPRPTSHPQRDLPSFVTVSRYPHPLSVAFFSDVTKGPATPTVSTNGYSDRSVATTGGPRPITQRGRLTFAEIRLVHQSGDLRLRDERSVDRGRRTGTVSGPAL